MERLDSKTLASDIIIKSLFYLYYICIIFSSISILYITVAQIISPGFDTVSLFSPILPNIIIYGFVLAIIVWLVNFLLLKANKAKTIITTQQWLISAGLILFPILIVIIHLVTAMRDLYTVY